MKIQFIRGWQNYRPGDVVEPSGVLREWLVNNGYCKPFEEPFSDPYRSQPALVKRAYKRKQKA